MVWQKLVGRWGVESGDCPEKQDKGRGGVRLFRTILGGAGQGMLFEQVIEAGTADSGNGTGLGHVAAAGPHQALQVMLFDIIGEYAAIFFQGRQGFGPLSLVV